jgi:predicted Rossmann-fold nucleotide-binding protein
VPTFSARLDTFMVLSDIFVITPGGIWTLLELFYTWQLMQVGHICRAPIILWWEEFKWLKEFMNSSVLEKWFVTKDESDLAIQVNTMDEVLALIDTAHEADEKLWDKACINIRQYLAGAKSLGLID